MIRPRLITLALAALCAFGLAGSADAMAKSTNNPQWQRCEKKAGGAFTDSACSIAGKGEFEILTLGEGEKLEFEVEAKGTQKLVATGLTIACPKLKAAKGAVVIGSKAPNAGTSEAILEFSECEVEKASECSINKEGSKKAKLATKTLKSTAVYETKEAAELEKGPLLTLIEPKEGKAFITVELSGTCPITGMVTFEGSVLSHVISGGGFAVKQELSAPSEALTKYFVNEAEKTLEKKAAGLKAVGLKATYVAGSQGNLSSKAAWRYNHNEP
jgi:hypothetical protein